MNLLQLEERENRYKSVVLAGSLGTGDSLPARCLNILYPVAGETVLHQSGSYIEHIEKTEEATESVLQDLLA
jgi:hypothetical protein